MEVILTFGTLTYVSNVPFLVLILSILFTTEPTNLKRYYQKP